MVKEYILLKELFLKNGNETLAKTLLEVDDNFARQFMNKFYFYWKLEYHINDAIIKYK